MPHVHLAPHSALTELRAQRLQLPVPSHRGSIQQLIDRERLWLSGYRSGRIDLRDRLLDAHQCMLPLLLTALSAPVSYSLADACLTTSAAGA
jgi:hypothetical protein